MVACSCSSTSCYHFALSGEWLQQQH
uniref:Uncharacterized protein n=1 Tax=Arundo donax TaxID=35708 RepID=A0A0A9GYM8_ARUDO